MTFPNLGFPTFPQFQQPTEGRIFFFGRGEGISGKNLQVASTYEVIFGYHFAKKRNGKEVKRKKKDIFFNFLTTLLSFLL